MQNGNHAESLRVLMVCARFPPYIGGTEAHVSELSARLAQRGHSVTVLTSVLDRSEANEQVERGVVVRRVPAYPRNADLYIAPQVHRLVTESEADVVHVQGYHTIVAPMAMNAAARAGLPYVVTFHSGGHSSRLRRALRPTHHRLLAPLVQRARVVIGVSDFERDFFVRRMSLDPARARTITNGVSDEFRTVARQAVSKSALIVSIGRLERYKGHHLVIEALKDVRRSVPAARLRVIGEGPFETELRELAQRLGVADAVEFTKVPYGDRQTLAERMAEADVIAILSSYESQGVAGLEAVATGARLVVAEGSALSELRRFDGVRVTPRLDMPKVVDALVAQLRLPRLRHRPHVPTWDTTTSAVERVYAQVLAGRTIVGTSAAEVACGS